MAYANVIYEKNEPATLRFVFNSHPETRSMEESFFLITSKMESRTLPLLRSAKEFIILSTKARELADRAADLLPKRESLLDDIRQVVKSIFKEFVLFTQWDEKAKASWSTFVQAPISWGIDGKNGASGGESFMILFLDSFLKIDGDCFMYTSKMSRYTNMASDIKSVIEAFRTENARLRFNAFLDMPKEKDPLWIKRGEIISSMYFWRLSHARIAKIMLKNSEGLASGLDKVMEGDGTVAVKTEMELLKRAKETLHAK